MRQVSGYRIHLNGLVQGVGFRPCVYQLARRQGLCGTVSNGMDGVHIYLQATREEADAFLNTLLTIVPEQAQITQTEMRPVTMPREKTFRIVESEATETASLLLPSDFGLCPLCRQELYDPANRRFGYPFITCAQCGPRYSIIKALPYDRPNTTMQPFRMCPDCRQEYDDPGNRRFYAQTNACPVCGPELSWYRAAETGFRLLSALHDYRWILPRLVWALRAGKIVAVKGIGGYLLVCDAANEAAVQTLRQRKHRPAKPFALLYPTLDAVREDVWVSESEQIALQSAAVPIVLLKRRPDARRTLAESVAPGLSRYGIMLPNAPLLDLMATGFGAPLVATSANISRNPIIYTDDKALDYLNGIADYVLSHNRTIAMPQDDSVVRFTEKHGQLVVIRRGRGLSPNYTTDIPVGPTTGRLAFGASLKGSFAVQLGGRMYVSQYLGDVESFDTQQNYRHVLNGMLRACVPSLPEPVFVARRLLVDQHEGYASTQTGLTLGEQYTIPVRKIQHHEAHFAAVLAENGLLTQPEPVLGVIWDGTGYGTDGQIWGGEFLLRSGAAHSGGFCERVACFPYFTFILGDKMPREPRLSALSLVYSFSEPEKAGERLTGLFSAAELALYRKLLSQTKQMTSSIGRLFDGVAVLLGLAQHNSYEGEAALCLEEAAGGYITQYGHQHLVTLGSDPATWIDTLLNDRAGADTTTLLAARFHVSLVEWVRAVAGSTGTRTLAFSGGVFQNAVLIDLLIDRLGREFRLVFHRQLSPNDECIAAGQLALDAVVTPV